MAVKTKAVLKAWHKAGYKDAAGDFDDLIDTMITAADNAASATEAGLVELATDAETQTGTATDRAITPANLQACTATATRKGVVELATDAETQAGTSTTHAITPANLAACTATATRAGVVELATDAEALAGTDTARALTAANLTSVVGAAAPSVNRIYYVDVNRTDTYTPDGTILRPYKTLKAAIDLINADAVVKAAAGNYALTNYEVHVAPGTYSDNLTFNNEKCLRIFGTGVTISGTVTLTQTQQSGDYYSRLEFIGASGARPEKGPALTISGAISGTRNNDSLTYVSFKGCNISGAQVYSENGTWVIHLENCYVSGIISGEMTGGGSPTVLLETTGFTTIKGHIAKANGDATNVCLYTIDNAELDLINITPTYGGRITNTVFGSDVTITTGTYYFDTISYKSMVAQTETLTGATIALLEQTATTAISGIVELATDAEAKAGTDTTHALTPDNLMQGAPALAAGVLTAAFVAKYTIAPDAAAAAAVHAAITLPAADTTVVTTEITNPDVPRILSITGNAGGITGNVVIVGTAIDGSAATDTIALSGTDTVNGDIAFATVTSITVPARNAEADTVTIGIGNSFGMPHVVANGLCLLVKIFDGSTDTGTLTVHADIESNLFAINGTPDGSKILSLYYLI